MWMYAVGAVVGLVLMFFIWAISSSYGSDFQDNAFDAFVDHSDTIPSNEKNKCDGQDKYFSSYHEPGYLVLILYGTEYGFCEEIAMTVFDRIEKLPKVNDFPWQPRLVNARDYECVDFDQENIVLVLISTAGDGVPPTDARGFYTAMMESSADHDLSHLHYSVLAMGDSNYPHYCKTGRSLDQCFEKLGAKMLTPRSDIDQEDWTAINEWTDRMMEELVCIQTSMDTHLDYLEPRGRASSEGFDRNDPFMATLKVKYDLTICGGTEDKETIHCEFDLTDSGLTWTAGDALGIYPTNSPDEVDKLLAAMRCLGNESVPVPKWAYKPRPDDEIPVREALLKYYDLKTVKPDLVTCLHLSASEPSSKCELDMLLENGVSKSNQLLAEYLDEREVADVLNDFSDSAENMTLDQILSQMKSLQPRYYSISSSPLVDRSSACVTAAVVRYITLGCKRTGVTTTFLQDRLQISQTCPVFMSRNPDFRMPSDLSIPVIMIGPGTGIAPFRAFLQERVLAKVSGQTVGRSVLYFGCRHKDKDYVYKEELESWHSEGQVDLRVAFSRDQEHKLYVQHLMAQDARPLWHLINKENAHIYICGDARYMAHDVHKTLLDIIQSEKGGTLQEAQSYLQELEETGHYQKDVWIT